MPKRKYGKRAASKGFALGMAKKEENKPVAGLARAKARKAANKPAKPAKAAKSSPRSGSKLGSGIIGVTRSPSKPRPKRVIGVIR
jgi:hypothetical protein